MIEQLESSLLRIYSIDRQVLGAGFLLAEQQVLTCAHVVARALGLSDNESEAPQIEVHLDLPLVAAGEILTARVSLWQPMLDVAGLEVTNTPPVGAKPVCLVRAKDWWGHTFRAFGFPDGYEGGVWASGVLRGRQADGWIQIEDVKQTGYFVQPGFSGAPVWDEELGGVVGMIVAADTQPGVRAAYLIPTDVLIEPWPELQTSLSDVKIEQPPVVDDEDAYRRQVAKMHREIDFIGIPELKDRKPVAINDIFVRLQVSREPTAVPSEATLEGDQVLWGTFTRDSTGHIKSHQLVTGLRLPRWVGDASLNAAAPMAVGQALSVARKVVVLGDPGTGKTTLLKYLTTICAERREVELGIGSRERGSVLPIYISLHEFAAECRERNHDYCVIDYFYTYAREHLLLHLPGGFFEEPLESGRCLVCLDGLDEVWADVQRRQVKEAIEALTRRYPENYYVVTSRVVGYEEMPLDRWEFIHHTIQPLENGDIEEFVHKWYAVRERDPVRRKRQIDQLIATINRETRIQALARNPLLLTIIALVHRVEAELPNERVKLYDKCVTTLVEKWDQVKGLTPEEKQRAFYQHRRRLLEQLAYELQTRAEKPGDVQVVKMGDLELLLAQFLGQNRRLGFADAPDAARDEARAFIRLVRSRTGLLVERGKDVFCFPHLTFQEYLAACDIENRCMPYGIGAVWDAIRSHLHDPNWREVILLLLGSLNRYEEAPTLMIESILKAGVLDEFEPVLHRHLFLVARALADQVNIASDLYELIVDSLLEIGRTAPWLERDDALAALSWLGGSDRVVEGLLASAQDPDIGVWERCDAAATLGQLGCLDKARQILCVLVKDRDAGDGIRRHAASALAQLGYTKEAINILENLAKASNVEASVRRDAAEVLAELGQVESAATSLMDIAELPNLEGWIPRAAVRTLGQLAPLNQRLLNRLLLLTCNPDVESWVRCDAVQTTKQLGQLEETAMWLLSVDHAVVTKACPSHNSVAQRERVNWPGEVPAIELLTLASNPKLRDEARLIALWILYQRGHKEDIVHTLTVLANDQDVQAWARRQASEILASSDRVEEAMSALSAIAGDSNVEAWARCDAAEAVGHLGCLEQATVVLLDLTNLQLSDWVRCNVGAALVRLGSTEKATDILLAVAADSTVHNVVRHAAVRTLGSVHSLNKTELDALRAIAQDTQVHPLVRGKAYESLKRLLRSSEIGRMQWRWPASHLREP